VINNTEIQTQMTTITIAQAIQFYLDSIRMARSENTARTYRNAMNIFSTVLADKKIDIDHESTDTLSENAIAWLATWLKVYSPATEQLYLTAVAGFFEFLAAERLGTPNLPRLRLLIRQRSRRVGQRLPQFPRSSIETIIVYATNLTLTPVNDEAERLRNLRDRAFIITLADTGLRVHEACSLRRGDVDWNEGKAIIIGKGDRQGVIRFSTRVLRALRDYLEARANLDGASKRSLATLPLFARHDKGVGNKIKRITTTTGRNIIAQRVAESLGNDAIGTITPHSFRHYFVTTVLHGSGNLKLAQELARHRNIAVTQRYAHLSDDELDKGYYDIFEADRK
jgi:integrase/recombinase XerC